MDINQLIADLQEISQKNSISHYKRDRCAEAATALATFQAENARLRAELDDLKAKWDKYQPREHWETLNELCENLHGELEQVKAERDAAMDCINQIQSARDHTRPAYVVDSILHNWKSRK